MGGNQVILSYRDVTVNVYEKLSPWKNDIIYTVGKKIWRWSIFKKRLGIENI